MSTTKSFTGTLAGILIAGGALEETTLVTDVLPALRGSAYERANVRHLLDMRVGLDFSEDYADPESDFAYLDAAGGWREPIRVDAPDSLIDFIVTVWAKPPHGGPFHYVSANAIVLGWVLEAVTRESFAELLSTHIWQPMGAEFDADLCLDRRGMSQTEGGLNVTLRDLARFGELHRCDGAMRGHQVVPAHWIADLRHNGDASAWDDGDMSGFLARAPLPFAVVHPSRSSAPTILYSGARSGRPCMWIPLPRWSSRSSAAIRRPPTTTPSTDR